MGSWYTIRAVGIMYGLEEKGKQGSCIHVIPLGEMMGRKRKGDEIHRFVHFYSILPSALENTSLTIQTPPRSPSHSRDIPYCDAPLDPPTTLDRSSFLVTPPGFKEGLAGVFSCI